MAKGRFQSILTSRSQSILPFYGLRAIILNTQRVLIRRSLLAGSSGVCALVAAMANNKRVKNKYDHRDFREIHTPDHWIIQGLDQYGKSHRNKSSYNNYKNYILDLKARPVGIIVMSNIIAKMIRSIAREGNGKSHQASIAQR